MEGYLVSSGDFNFQLILLPLGELYLHEETIPELVEKLAMEIEGIRVLRNPVIVDSEHKVVLDGTHRVEALGRIGCVHVPSCILDYFNPKVLVGRWFRVFQCKVFEETAKRALRHLGFDSLESPIERVLDGLNDREMACGLFWRSGGLKILNNDGSGLIDKLDKVRKIEMELRNLGCTVGYEIEAEALEKLLEGSVDGVLALPPVDKRDVIECALKGYRFPRKTTRHVVPARPWNVNVPLNLLERKDLSLEEANKSFLRLLKEKQVRRIPPGAILDGRRYEEEIYEFVDK